MNFRSVEMNFRSVEINSRWQIIKEKYPLKKIKETSKIKNEDIKGIFAIFIYEGKMM